MQPRRYAAKRLPAPHAGNSPFDSVPCRRRSDYQLTGLTIRVSHFPPGTSKWNKIEHRLFCHITENWRGRPLVDRETVVQLIGSVRTTTGLTVKAQLDTRAYPTGIKVPDSEMEQVVITRAEFHGDWNYTIHPRAAHS